MKVAYIIGGIVVAAGIATGAYFYYRPKMSDETKLDSIEDEDLDAPPSQKSTPDTETDEGSDKRRRSEESQKKKAKEQLKQLHSEPEVMVVSKKKSLAPLDNKISKSMPDMDSRARPSGGIPSIKISSVNKLLKTFKVTMGGTTIKINFKKGGRGGHFQTIKREIGISGEYTLVVNPIVNNPGRRGDRPDRRSQIEGATVAIFKDGAEVKRKPMGFGQGLPPIVERILARPPREVRMSKKQQERRKMYASRNTGRRSVRSDNA